MAFSLVVYRADSGDIVTQLESRVSTRRTGPSHMILEALLGSRTETKDFRPAVSASLSCSDLVTRGRS